MNKKCFLFKEITEQGYEVLCTGISSINAEIDIKDLAQKLRKMKIKMVDDPFYIDYIMAVYIQKICAHTIYGVGLSIKIPGIVSSTGGIIGSPHKSPSSAEGLGEDIGHGLSVAAYPGGPGLIIEGKTNEAETILKVVEQESSGIHVLEKMKDKALGLGIRKAVMICDGTGKNNIGCVLTINNDEVEKIAFQLLSSNN